MSKPNYLLDVFEALKISEILTNISSKPNLIFSVEPTNNINEWNLRLPRFKMGPDTIIGREHVYKRDEITNEKLDPPQVLQYDPALRHYQHVIESNCQRLLKGTASACVQAGAVFMTDSNYDHIEGRDQVTEWISNSGVEVPVLAIAGKNDFTQTLYETLKSRALDYDTDDEEDENGKTQEDGDAPADEVYIFGLLINAMNIY